MTDTTTRRRRPDGRLISDTKDEIASTTLRPLSCELSCLHRADGSALWKSGSTHVLAAAYGPVAPRIPSQEDAQQALVSVVLKSSSASSVTVEWERWLASVLSACVCTESYARAVVQIVLQVVQDDGSVLAAALHAAVAALMDAGVAMNALPVATTFLVSGSEQSLLFLDPTSEEEKDEGDSVLVMCTENENPDQILATLSSVGKQKTSNEEDGGGGFAIPTILACAQAAAKATPAVVTFWRLAMEQRVTRESQTLWSSN